MDANFIVPGFYENRKVNCALLDLLNKHPEYFNDNVRISAVYGNFQFCTWDGGRIFNNYNQATYEQIQDIIDTYNNKFHIPIRLIFTNTLITEELCYDRFNNLVLSLCHNGLNEIVINSPVLEQYIRENYPNYKFISSTTKCILDANKLKEELDNPNYKMVCLDYNLNHSKNLLDSLTPEEREKSEFLINAICGPACPNRKHHYDLNSQSHLNYGKRYAMSFCGIEDNNLGDIQAKKTHLTVDEIYDYYLPNGFHHFKMEGRTFTPLVHLCNCVKFMVKPEYQLYVISICEGALF